MSSAPRPSRSARLEMPNPGHGRRVRGTVEPTRGEGARAGLSPPPPARRAPHRLPERGAVSRSLEWQRARACQVGRGGERHPSPPFPFSPGDGRRLQRVPPGGEGGGNGGAATAPPERRGGARCLPADWLPHPGPECGMCPSSPESRPVCRSPGGASWLAPIPGLLAVRVAGLGPGLVNFTLGAAALPGRVGGGSGSVSGACYFWAPWLPGWGWRTAVE